MQIERVCAAVSCLSPLRDPGGELESIPAVARREAGTTEALNITRGFLLMVPMQ